MSNTLTIRLPEDLAESLDAQAKKSGVPRGQIVRTELERARSLTEKPFMRLAGRMSGQPDLSMRKGYARR